MMLSLLLITLTAVANEPGAQSLQDGEIPRLERRIEQLEHRLERLEKKPPPRQSAAEDGTDGAVYIAEGIAVPEVSTVMQDAVIAGRVIGDVTSVGGNIRVKSTGIIQGDAVSIGGEITIEDGGSITGNQAEMPYSTDSLSGPLLGGVGLFEQIARRLIFLLTFAGLGVLMVGLFPDRINSVANNLQARPFRSLFTGTLWATLIGVLSGIFAIICIGLPLAVILLSGLGLAWLLGFVGLCQLLGDRLPFTDKTHGRWLTFLVGSAVVSFISVLPWIGVFALIITGLMGIGSAFSTRFGTR